MISDLEMMKSPLEWPNHPFLPVKRWVDDDLQTGLLLAVEGHLTTVFGYNLFRLPKCKNFRELVEANVPKFEYQSHDAIVNDGWRVD